MKVAIVDDRPEELNRILQITEKALPQANLFTFPSGEAFLETWKHGEYDLILLDIFMDGILGIDVARKVHEEDMDVRLVFFTTSNEFASESYAVGASYYLHKPYSAADIRRMVTRVRPKNYELTRYILLPDGQKVILRDIVYTEYENHIISIHRKRGGVLQTRMSQGALEALVATDTYLVSCAKGLLVNLYEAQKLEGDSIYMTGGICLPVSRRRSKDMQKLYEDHLFRRMREEML